MRNLKYWRKQFGLTQKSLASMINLSEGYIRKMENGNKEPSLPTARKMAAVFGICYKDLLDCPGKDCEKCEYTCKTTIKDEEL
jgi:DNA-binding XRE family transcriptional regulator